MRLKSIIASLVIVFALICIAWVGFTAIKFIAVGLLLALIIFVMYGVFNSLCRAPNGDDWDGITR